VEKDRTKIRVATKIWSINQKIKTLRMEEKIRLITFGKVKLRMAKKRKKKLKN